MTMPYGGRIYERDSSKFILTLTSFKRREGSLGFSLPSGEDHLLRLKN
jgi:hypothetical protein